LARTLGTRFHGVDGVREVAGLFGNSALSSWDFPQAVPLES